MRVDRIDSQSCAQKWERCGFATRNRLSLILGRHTTLITPSIESLARSDASRTIPLNHPHSRSGNAFGGISVSQPRDQRRRGQ